LSLKKVKKINLSQSYFKESERNISKVFVFVATSEDSGLLSGMNVGWMVVVGVLLVFREKRNLSPGFPSQPHPKTRTRSCLSTRKAHVLHSFSQRHCIYENIQEKKSIVLHFLYKCFINTTNVTFDLGGESISLIKRSHMMSIVKYFN
jgi:hypothetical protein